MARKTRIAVLVTLVAGATMVAATLAVYVAVRQVRPFYEQALQVEPAVLEAGSRELESRATALYSDARLSGQWSALFTEEQINGWLATQLTGDRALPEGIREPRVSITPNTLSLAFRSTLGGVDTVVSVDAAASLTESGAVAVRLESVRAGAIPLPVVQVADELAEACRQLSRPIRWTQEAGQPVALIALHSETAANKRKFYLDAIELGEGQVYVAGHTDSRDARDVELSDYELRIDPTDPQSPLEVARRSTTVIDDEGQSPEH